jgi:threonine dehydratase
VHAVLAPVVGAAHTALTVVRAMSEAAALLASYFPPTRMAPAASLSTPDCDVHLKLETDLPTGTFKVRGAVYSLSANVARRALHEVVAASTGNHGAAVAYAASVLKIPARIFLPAHPNPVKAARIRGLGATLVETGADLSAAIDAAGDYAARTGAFFLHDASDPDVPLGTATIGEEIAEQLPGADIVYVPMGDTALIRGVASAAKTLKPSIRIVGVVAKDAPAYFESWRSGTVVETASANTIADGLAVRRPLAPNVAAIRVLVDDVEPVSEDELLAAIAWLDAREGVIAEPAGAAATAALLKRRDRARTAVALVTGANIAPDVLEAARRRSD